MASSSQKPGKRKTDFSGILEVMSGERRGWFAAVARGTLACLTPLYRLGIGWKNFCFNNRLFRINRTRAVVISVGNLTTGGCGKTPFVIWLAGQLTLAESEYRLPIGGSVRVGIVSRGYGASDSEPNDEAKEIERRLPGLPHVQDRNRFWASEKAVRDNDCNVLILDDGFQHRQLARNLDIVLIDATNPFGFNHLLPRGLLREPVFNIRRADVVVLTRSDLVDQARRVDIRTRVQKFNPEAIWCETRVRPECWARFYGATNPIGQIPGKRVFGFCGIGNPDAFRQTLEKVGVPLEGWRSFPDHHHFSIEDLNEIIEDARDLGCDAIVCTDKDLVKIESNELGGFPLWSFRAGIHFSHGQKQLEQTLVRLFETVSNLC